MLNGDPGIRGAKSRSRRVSPGCVAMRRPLLLLCLTLSAITGNAGEAPAFTGKQLTEFPVDNWLTNGGNVLNQRYSPLTEINSSNVAELKAEWQAHLNGSGVGPPYSGEAQPIVYDGVVYIPTGADDVFALDVETGKPIWVYQSKLDNLITAGLLRLDEPRCRNRRGKNLSGAS